LITRLTAKACIRALPTRTDDFDPEYIRVAKILGGSLNDSTVMSGLIVQRNAEGTIQRVSNPRVAVFNAPLDP